MLLEYRDREVSECENDEIDRDCRTYYRAQRRAFYIIALTALLFIFMPAVAFMLARLLGVSVL